MSKLASLGDMVQFNHNKQKVNGKVIMVRENSVIVELGENHKGEPIKTVINHKNYEIVS